jgi:proteasome lid subunit RPN8/RPN11
MNDGRAKSAIKPFAAIATSLVRSATLSAATNALRAAIAVTKTTAKPAFRNARIAEKPTANLALTTTKGVTSAMIKRHKKTMKRPKRKKQPSPNTPSLRFSPTAWAKLLYLRDRGDTEVGGFGITAADDLLYVEDIQLVRQTTSWTHVAFDDESVADFFDAQVDAGRQPEQFARIWIHTHPGDCPQPSSTDEETFASAFGRSDWAIMFILARNGATYARLRFNVGPRVDTVIPIEVDYSRPFPACDMDAWEAEYQTNVVPEVLALGNNALPQASPVVGNDFDDEYWNEDWGDLTNAHPSTEGFFL